MTVLGDALEAAFSSNAAWDSVFAAGRRWRDPKLLIELGARARELDGLSRGPSAHPDDKPSAQTWRFWSLLPDRVRRECDHARGATTFVEVGHTWRAWDPIHGGITNNGRRNEGINIGPDEGVLFAPRAALTDLAVVDAAPTLVLDRPTFVVTGRPESGRSRRTGADEVRVTVDVERAVLLRLEYRLEGRPFEIHEMTELEFDRPMSDELFELSTPDGSPFVDASERREP